MRHILIAAVAALVASQAAWGQSAVGAGGTSGGAGTGGNVSTSNPAGMSGGLGNSGLPQQVPGTNSLGTANSGGGATVGHSNPDRPGSLDVTDPLQKDVDKKMNGICRGC